VVLARRRRASHSLEPFELVYDELFGQPHRVMREALAHLGHEGDATLEPTSRAGRPTVRASGPVQPS
jgi:hypothetical protein